MIAVCEPDAKFQRITVSIKQPKTARIQELPAPQRENYLFSALKRMDTWTIGYWSRQLCKQLFKGLSIGGILAAMRPFANLEIFIGHIFTVTLLQVKTYKECTDAGKNFQFANLQGHYGKLAVAVFVLDDFFWFCRPFRVATKTK